VVNFFHPILTPERTTNFPYLLLTAITAAFTLVTGYLAFADRKKDKRQVKGDKQQALRNRQVMLKLVWKNWIVDVLNQSLYSELLKEQGPLKLDMEKRPDAVDWHQSDTKSQYPEQPDRMIPPGSKMLDVFNETGGALLILGEPGSGKTTMLLELARQAIE
jgi:predicted NACHT family NTPase